MSLGNTYIHKYTHTHSRVSFCNSSFYDLCPVRPSTPDLWCITVMTQASFLYLWASSSFLVCICFFFLYFSAVLLSWLLFFHPQHPPKRKKRKKIKTVDITFFLDVFWTMAWAFFNKIKSDLIDIFFNYLCFSYIPNTLN